MTIAGRFPSPSGMKRLAVTNTPGMVSKISFSMEYPSRRKRATVRVLRGVRSGIVPIAAIILRRISARFASYSDFDRTPRHASSHAMSSAPISRVAYDALETSAAPYGKTLSEM